jgi:hypothetical protein
MNATGKFRPFGLLLLANCALWIAACSGGSSPLNLANTGSGCSPSDPTTAADCGSIIVALTDVEGDFTAYAVDVLSISLERADGTQIETLPRSVRVDFAQLTSLTELINATTVVPGDFVGGHIRLDYSDAEIYVEAGGEIVPAQVYDADGTLLTAVTPDSVVDVEIRLPNSDRLIVTGGRTALLSIDFDLTASHVVDTTTSPVSVVAQPYLVAEVEPVDEKEIRVRGTLVDVDVDAGTYDIRLRPWLHRAGDFGVFTVITNDTTTFEIDEIAYVGSDGLRALADQPQGTLTVAFGTLDLSDRSFTADIVHAGDSVGGDRYSAVVGNIVARNGDQLVIKGAVAIRRDRRAHFHRTVIVEIGPDTQVTRLGDPATDYDKDDLSVGQRTMVFGQFANPAVDNSDRFGPDIALVLDATEGRARMLVTSLLGTVNQVQTGQIDVQLRAIDRLSVGLFDFSGTGISPDFDADPMTYEIATSTLALDALATVNTLEVQRPVRALGFVAPFGEAPPDFEGRTLIGPRDLPAVLGVGWGIEGTAAPFSVMVSNSLVIDLDNDDIGVRHHMLIGDRLIDLFDLPASPSLIESGIPRVYGIWEPGHVELFKNFSDFVDELALRLGESDRARSLSAYGRYSDGENSLTANKVVVHMLPAASP